MAVWRFDGSASAARQAASRWSLIRGHGFGDFEIGANATIKGDSCHIAISSPPQAPYFINSYEGNSHSGVYLGLLMFAAFPPP